MQQSGFRLLTTAGDGVLAQVLIEPDGECLLKCASTGFDEFGVEAVLPKAFLFFI